MTNEEKAREIVHRMHFVIPYQGASPKNLKSEMKFSLLEMAEWKDHQFKEYLEKKYKEASNSYDKTEAKFYEDRMDYITEIINEFFKEE